MTDRAQPTVANENELYGNDNRVWSAWVDMGRSDIWGTETPPSEETITINLAEFPGECKVSRLKLMDKSGFFWGMLSSDCQVSLILDKSCDRRIRIDFNCRKRPPSQ